MNCVVCVRVVCGVSGRFRMAGSCRTMLLACIHVSTRQYKIQTHRFDNTFFRINLQSVVRSATVTEACTFSSFFHNQVGKSEAVSCAAVVSVSRTTASAAVGTASQCWGPDRIRFKFSANSSYHTVLIESLFKPRLQLFKTSNSITQLFALHPSGTVIALVFTESGTAKLHHTLNDFCNSDQKSIYFI